MQKKSLHQTSIGFNNQELILGINDLDFENIIYQAITEKEKSNCKDTKSNQPYNPQPIAPCTNTHCKGCTQYKG